MPVRKHTNCPWVLLYLERWLRAVDKPFVVPYLKPGKFDAMRAHVVGCCYRLLILVMLDVMRDVDLVAIIPEADAVKGHGVFPLSAGRFRRAILMPRLAGYLIRLPRLMR